MGHRIRQLRSTILGGQRLTRRHPADRHHVAPAEPHRTGPHGLRAPALADPNGRKLLQQARGLLEERERFGILTLPARRGPGRGRQRPVGPGSGSDPQEAIGGTLADLTPLALERAREPEQVAAWNAWVQRYHLLGCRQPIGAHMRYLRRGRPLGCLLFDFAARQLACRDRWIGWQRQAYRRQLPLVVVRNAHYLLFPWVEARNLASHALGLATRQLPGDWERLHGYRPVLYETCVNPTQSAGTCDRAANWQLIGQTKGQAKDGPAKAKPPKQVWVYPLQRILLDGRAR